MLLRLPFPSPALVVVLALLLLPGATSRAGDGVIEINQVIATQQGVDADDPPGFPVLITRSGSYRLTSDLRVQILNSPAPDAVDIRADDVTLDLNGFTIRCTTSPIVTGSCSTRGGSGDGIQIVEAEGVRIHSGNIRGFPGHGIFGSQSGTAYVVDAVRSTENGLDGIYSAGNAQIYRSQFVDNGRYGIQARAFTDLVLDVFTEGNGTAGIVDTGSALAVGRSQFRDGIAGIIQPASLVGCIQDVATRVCP